MTDIATRLRWGYTPNIWSHEAADEIQRLRAALAEAQRVPDGWRLVPVEPTGAMRRAGWYSLEEAIGCANVNEDGCSYCETPKSDSCRIACISVYRAMLDAAPQPAPQEAE